MRRGIEGVGGSSDPFGLPGGRPSPATSNVQVQPSNEDGWSEDGWDDGEQWDDRPVGRATYRQRPSRPAQRRKSLPSKRKRQGAADVVLGEPDRRGRSR